MRTLLRSAGASDAKRQRAKTFCAIDDAHTSRILGFYTIAPSAVAHDSAPPPMTKRLARHEVAGFKLARLATDLSVAGRGLGGQLLAAAARRCLRLAGEGGGLLLIIDAKSDRAAGWYASYGAQPLNDRPLTLAMALATFAPELKSRRDL